MMFIFKVIPICFLILMYGILPFLYLKTKNYYNMKEELEKRYGKTKSVIDGDALTKCEEQFYSHVIALLGLSLACLAVPFSYKFFLAAFGWQL